MIAEMLRAGELCQRLWTFTQEPPRFASATVAFPLCEESLAVIKELMDEIQRRDIREDHARRKADELVGWLNGRWG